MQKIVGTGLPKLVMLCKFLTLYNLKPIRFKFSLAFKIYRGIWIHYSKYSWKWTNLHSASSLIKPSISELFAVNVRVCPRVAGSFATSVQPPQPLSTSQGEGRTGAGTLLPSLLQGLGFAGQRAAREGSWCWLLTQRWKLCGWLSGRPISWINFIW